MIFAAGRGTRLGAIGEATPKALIEIAGRTMLEHAVRAMRHAAVRRVVVNVHHHAGRIERFIAGHDLGVEVLVSREDDRPLETGGGLLHARGLFHAGEPILMHNVDVLSSFHLCPLIALAGCGGAVAALAVQERDTARRLLFDDAGLLGREDRRDGTRLEVRPPCGEVRALAFSGIHVASPELPGLITERGVFPILDVYLRLAAAGRLIVPHVSDEGMWLEIGNLERLETAKRLGAEAMRRAGEIERRCGQTPSA